ncbi:MAG: glycosyl transferase group 1 family protein [Bacteroidetes bacterium]|nr:glycosyl transferase group 1 family protein [Bacteroidota bacterium]
MKVLYDYQTFTMQEYGGISRYFYELIARGAKDRDMNVDVSLRLSNNAYLNGSSYPGLYRFFPGKQFKGKSRIMHAVNRGKSERMISKGNYDVLHPTYYDTYFLKNLPAGKPFTVTFLDMIHEKFADKYEELRGDIGIYENKKELLQHASKVIAISECTKRDIIDIFGVDGDKIEVIYLGSSFNSGSASSNRLVAAPYLLFVGNRSIYKNFSLFVESVKPILDANKELKIVCAGGGNFSVAEKEQFQRLQITDRVLFHRIDDSTLASLYKYAEVFVFPSLYEGFGIPVLEAFACGCPCLLSSGGSLPEVGGDAALYFDPLDVNEISTAVNSILHDTEKRAELISKGLKRLEQFSWNNTYQNTLAFYKSLA